MCYAVLCRDVMCGAVKSLCGVHGSRHMVVGSRYGMVCGSRHGMVPVTVRFAVLCCSDRLCSVLREDVLCC